MTAQCWEEITIDGNRFGMTSLPLDAWLATRSPPLDMKIICPWFTSMLWRGYIGLWRIEADRLWLDGMTRDTDADPDCPDRLPARLICVQPGQILSIEVDMRLIFDGAPGPIDCTWFTGKLRLPLEPQLTYVHMGWGSTYRYERIIHVQQGRVVRERHVDHTARFLATYADLRDVLTESDHPDHLMGLRGLTWLTDEGYALVAEHLGLAPIRPEEP